MSNVMFFTGAGISANAGIPVYRSAGSSWTDSDLEAKSHANRYGNHLAELWDKHWGPLSLQMLSAAPTYAHRAVGNYGGLVVTQNIDDLHERAGSEDVRHLHGTMKTKCMRCRSTEVARYQVKLGAPACLNCGSHRTRPDVVLFGENLNKKRYREIVKHTHTITHLVVIGSSLNVHPAAGLVMDLLSSKVHTICINKDKTPFHPWFKETYLEDADLVIDDVLKGL